MTTDRLAPLMDAPTFILWSASEPGPGPAGCMPTQPPTPVLLSALSLVVRLQRGFTQLTARHAILQSTARLRPSCAVGGHTEKQADQRNGFNVGLAAET